MSVISRTTPSIALLCAWLSSGCGGALGAAEGQFGDGEYPAAHEALARLETEARGWTGRRRAEYALYRGLTMAALGDEERAAPWIREARRVELTHPGSLTAEDAARLLVAVDAYEFVAEERPGPGEHADAAPRDR